MSEDVISLEPNRVYSLQDLELHVVSAALLDTDILEYVSSKYKNRLTGQASSLFSAASVYFNLTRGPLTRQALASILMNNEPDLNKHQDYLALYDTLTSPPYSEYTEAEKRWFLVEFDGEWKVDYTGQTLAGAAEAMRLGHMSHNHRLLGSDAAWKYIEERRLDFDMLTAGANFSSAEMTSSTDQAKIDYSWAVENKNIGIPMAIAEVQDRLYGLRAGDLLLVTAYAAQGKSFFMLNDGHNAWIHGNNVAIATGEMSVKKYRNRFIALHSCQSKFKFPLETTKIDRGQLSTEEHEVFLDVLGDIRDNPAYGKIFIFQFPFRATPTMIFNKFSSYDQIVPIDMAIVDYIGLMASERNRVSRREELDDLIRETKALALDFSDGRGVALEAGYQVNRVSYEKARHEGYYTLSCFSESSEAEKSADSALWLLEQPQNPDELKVGFIKNRDDELGEPFHIRRNLRHAQLTTMQSTRGRGPAGTGADLLDV